MNYIKIIYYTINLIKIKEEIENTKVLTKVNIFFDSNFSFIKYKNGIENVIMTSILKIFFPA